MWRLERSVRTRDARNHYRANRWDVRLKAEAGGKRITFEACPVRETKKPAGYAAQRHRTAAGADVKADYLIGPSGAAGVSPVAPHW